MTTWTITPDPDPHLGEWIIRRDGEIAGTVHTYKSPQDAWTALLCVEGQMIGRNLAWRRIDNGGFEATENGAAQ